LHLEITIVAPIAPAVLQLPECSSVLGSVCNHGNGVSSGVASSTAGVYGSAGERKGEEILLHLETDGEGTLFDELFHHTGHNISVNLRN
jgi:hypothetical protein